MLDKADQTLDAVYIQAKETIKAQKELIGQDIERMKGDEEMNEKEKKSLHNLYLDDYKCLMKSIQDLTQSIEKGKGEMEKRGNIEMESKDLWTAVDEDNLKKVKSLLKKGIADVDWKNPNAVMIFTMFSFYSILIRLFLKRGMTLHSCMQVIMVG